MNNFDPNSLLAEKSLWSIYRESRRIPVSWVNQILSVVVFALLVAYVAFSGADASHLAQKAKDLASIGFTFSTTILGFLVTGFTIFATISKPDLFMKMAMHQESKSGLSYLKYTFFGLMKVFFVYVIFSAYAYIFQALFDVSVPVSAWVIENVDYPAEVLNWISALLFIANGTWAFHLIMMLQSFVYNIYNIVMVSIRWEFVPKEAAN